jgi:hypothetical protein
MEEIPDGKISVSKSRWERAKKTRGQYAKERRVALLKRLAPPSAQSPEAGLCDSCGERHAYEHLDVDHLDGRSWELRKLSRWGRVARFWREFEAGVRMRALCKSCNRREGGGRRYPGGRR